MVVDVVLGKKDWWWGGSFAVFALDLARNSNYGLSGMKRKLVKYLYVGRIPSVVWQCLFT